jgi:hypothetical protein
VYRFMNITNMSSWVESAEQFCGSYGFGSRGKHIGIGRMLNPSDIPQLQTSQSMVCTYRPRGILSGFLVIPPELHYAIYLPPTASKQQPQRFRIRLTKQHHTHGMILSAYLYNKQVLIEDIIAIDGHAIWYTKPFQQRWERLRQLFTSEWRQDIYLQTIEFQCITLLPLSGLSEPSDDKIIEFIPSGGGQKRLLWIPTRSTTSSGHSGDTKHHTAKRDASMGPDVYILYDGETKLGSALIRTLSASRALRLAFMSGVEGVRVQTKFNKQFDKWEVLDVAA